jgi:hypothetical protein
MCRIIKKKKYSAAFPGKRWAPPPFVLDFQGVKEADYLSPDIAILHPS